MSSDNIDVKELEKKVETLSQMIETVVKSIEPLSGLADITKSIDAIAKEVESLTKTVPDKTSMDGIRQAIVKTDVDGISEKIDTLSKRVEKVDNDVSEVKESKEIEVLYKKLDDLLLSVNDIGSKVEEANATERIASLDEKVGNISSSMSDVTTNIEQLRDSSDTEILGKKIDDLMHYVAGLSALEEKVDDMAKSFAETQEIVGIIVRQLDDIERKYNKTIEDLSEAMGVVKSLTEDGTTDSDATTEKSTKSKKKPKDNDEDEKAPTISADASTIDDLMKQLLAKVKPQTEAKEMAVTLEEVRDKLTTMIEGHTPVLFQFGTRARELKSYPPTATLNENDIARLNKEIRDWTSKLKKLTTT